MYYLDLFSGIGGFALGAYWAGWRFDEHYYSEIDKYCNELYRLRFPDAIPLGDITTLNAENLPQGIWVVTGGFPCQDISVAGKGEGISGARSGLWFEMWRIIRILRPRFVIIENVGAITFRGLDSVLGSLAEIGYDAEWQDIRASDVGALHKRERIWIVAYPQVSGTGKNNGGIWKGISGISRGQGTKKEDVAYSRLLGQTKCEEQTAGIKQRSQDVADTRSLGCREGTIERRTIPEEARRAESDIGNQTSDVPDTEGIHVQRQQNRQGKGESWRSCGWESEPDVGRLAHGIPRRVDRLKGLGNSIVPQIAELLFRRIGETYE